MAVSVVVLVAGAGAAGGYQRTTAAVQCGRMESTAQRVIARLQSNQRGSLEAYPYPLQAETSGM